MASSCADIKPSTFDFTGRVRRRRRHSLFSPDREEYPGPSWPPGPRPRCPIVASPCASNASGASALPGNVQHETVRGLTSLPAQRATLEAVLKLVRGRWSIENRLHHVRGVSCGEDPPMLGGRQPSPAPEGAGGFAKRSGRPAGSTAHSEGLGWNPAIGHEEAVATATARRVTRIPPWARRRRRRRHGGDATMFSG